MAFRWVVVAVLVAAFAGLAIPGASATGGGPTPDAETVVVELNPGASDRVILDLPVDETDDPVGRARRLAARADLPVYGVAVETVEDPVRIVAVDSGAVDDGVTVVDGGTVNDGGTYYRTRIATDVGTRTGPLGGELSRGRLSALAPTDAPAVTVVAPRGTAVTPATARTRSLFERGHEVAGGFDQSDGAITYRVPADRLRLLGAVVVASFLVPFGLVRARARSIAAADRADAERVHRLRRLRILAMTVGPGIAMLTGIFGGALALAAFLAGWLVPVAVTGTWWAVTLWVVGLAPVVGLPWLATNLAIRPAYRDLHGSAETRRSVAWNWLKRYALTAASVWVAAVVFAAYADRALSNPVFGAGVVGALVLVNGALAPVVIRLFNETRPVTGAVRDDVDELCAERGVGIRGAYLLETGESIAANGFAAGLPRWHWVFLTSDLVDEFEPRHRRAVLAHELGHVTHRHLLQRAAFATAWAFVVLVVYATLVESLGVLLLGLGLYAYAGMGWLAHRQEYEADEYAASVTSPETMVDALERLAAVNTTQRATGRLYDLVVRHPSFADRIDRLEARPDDAADADAGRPTERTESTHDDP